MQCKRTCHDVEYMDSANVAQGGAHCRPGRALVHTGKEKGSSRIKVHVKLPCSKGSSHRQWHTFDTHIPAAPSPRCAPTLLRPAAECAASPHASERCCITFCASSLVLLVAAVHVRQPEAELAALLAGAHAAPAVCEAAGAACRAPLRPLAARQHTALQVVQPPCNLFAACRSSECYAA